MSSQMKQIVIILFVMFLVSCSKSLDIQLAPEAHVFLSSDGERKILLTQKDEIYGILNKWLRENNRGWYATSGRYPGGVYIKSGDHGIQITEHKVVIYTTKSSKPKAIYVQEIEKRELSKIVNFGK
jgi:hypothetical protein